MINAINFNQYFSKLHLRGGIWHSDKTSHLSYASKYYAICFQLEEKSFWFKHRNECIQASMKNFPVGEMLFDVGGGNGFVTAFLEKEGIPCALIEPGIPAAENAAKRGVTRIVCATLENASLPEATVPSIGLFDVVEHIPDDKIFLTDVKKYLIPGGRIYITVPAYNFLWAQEDTNGGHFRRYTTGSLSKVLDETGFDVEYTTYLFSVLIPFVFLFRSLPGMLGIKRDVDSQEKYNKEHSDEKGILEKVFQYVWDWERKRIATGKRIPFGTTCLAVARKR